MKRMVQNNTVYKYSILSRWPEFFQRLTSTDSKLTSYAWPGNVRELENTLTRAVVLAKTDVLDETLIPRALQAPELIPSLVEALGGRT